MVIPDSPQDLSRDRKKYGNTVRNHRIKQYNAIYGARRIPYLKVTRSTASFLVRAREVVLQFFQQFNCGCPAWVSGLDLAPRMSKGRLTRRTSEAFELAPSRHPLVVGHMYKENKTHTMFNKRYFALYGGGLLVYYKHERSFKNDVKRHEGLPLHCKLVNLKGLYLSWPESHFHGAKFCFRLHAPENSNHRHEFLLACHNKKEMKIWIEQLQSQNPNLQPPSKGERLHKVPSYIMKMRVQSGSCSDPISKLSPEWLKQAHSSPGAVALFFRIGSDTELDSH